MPDLPIGSFFSIAHFGIALPTKFLKKPAVRTLWGRLLPTKYFLQHFVITQISRVTEAACTDPNTDPKAFDDLHWLIPTAGTLFRRSSPPMNSLMPMLSSISFISFVPPQAVTFLSVNDTCISFTFWVAFGYTVKLIISSSCKPDYFLMNNLGLNPHYAIEMHLHNLTNENQKLTLKNIFPIGWFSLSGHDASVMIL